MKRLLLYCLVTVACFAFAQAQLTGAEFDKGYRVLFLSEASPQNSGDQNVVLPEKGNIENLQKLVETQPGSNIYTGFGNRTFYIYTKLVDDGTFVPGKNCIGLTSEKVFTREDDPVLKLSLMEGAEAYPFNLVAIHNYSWSYAKMLVDLNTMEVYVEPYVQFWPLIKGHENDTTYKNFENLTPAGDNMYASMRYTFTEGQEFRLLSSLIPYSSYYEGWEIANVYCPSEDKTVNINDNGIAFVKDSYQYLWENKGWWKITKSGDYRMNYVEHYDSETQKNTSVMKFTEIGSVKALYISTYGSTDMEDPDNVFNWQSYQVPSADKQSEWAEKLLPVEGQPGVFAGDVAFAYHPQWNVLGAVCFDTFRTDENADYAVMATYPTELQNPEFYNKYSVCDPYNMGSRRVTIYFPGITAPITTKMIVDLNKGTVEAMIEPENYAADVKLNKSEVLYLVGSPQGWNIDNVPAEWQLGADSEGVFTRTFFIPENQFIFRFYTSIGNWENGSIGIQEMDSPEEISFFNGGCYEGNCCYGKGCWMISDWKGGYVTMQVDLQNMHVKFTETDAIPDGEPLPGEAAFLVDLYDNVTLSGDFGSFNLTNASSSPYTYKAVVDIPAGAHNFSITADGTSIGAWKDGRIVPISMGAKFFQRYFVDNDNLWAIPEEWKGGKVEVAMDLLTQNLWFNVPQPTSIENFPETMEIVGAFTNSWSPVDHLALTNLGDGIYEGTFQMEANCGEFKFREIDNWMVCIGPLFASDDTFFTKGSPQTLQGTAGGGNFKLSDKFAGGEVSFRIDLKDMTVTAFTSADTGIILPADKVSSLCGAHGMLIVAGMADTQLRVFDLSGRLVLNVTPASDLESYPLAPGFYVAAGQKLVIR